MNWLMPCKLRSLSCAPDNILNCFGEWHHDHSTMTREQEQCHSTLVMGSLSSLSIYAQSYHVSPALTIPNRQHLMVACIIRYYGIVMQRFVIYSPPEGITRAYILIIFLDVLCFVRMGTSQALKFACQDSALRSRTWLIGQCDILAATSI